ncbi:MAG: SurA N-terminal domain-containing protein, partial [Clostridia bacterium]|nr:SurA N-terminal domain-containing protein [Clostridia bacterium]
MKLSKILILALAVVMCMTCIPAAAEEAPITVVLDGEYVQFDVQPTIIDGRTLVPMRAIFEALGAQVEWQGETQTASSQKGDTKVAIQIDNTQMKVNDNEITLDVPARLIDSRTLVPVRAISEAYDCHVSWNSGKRTVVIISDLTNTEIMNVNGASVSAGYFNYCLYNAELNIAQNLGTTMERIAEMWTSSLGDITFDKYISDIAADQVVVLKSAVAEAKKLGLEITEEDTAGIAQTISSLKANYDSEESYLEVLNQLGTSEAALESYLTDVMYVSKLYEKYEAEYGMNDAEIKKYLDENYVQAQHVLISTEGLDDEAKAEKKA